MRKELPICALAITLVFGFVRVACAEVRIEGDQATVKIATDKASISDVLSALAAKFDLEFRSAIPLSERASNAYSGSLNQVIFRLLDGSNFLIKSGEGTFEILVFGKGGDKLALPPRQESQMKTVRSLWK
jgi:hypothetical protein